LPLRRTRSHFARRTALALCARTALAPCARIARGGRRRGLALAARSLMLTHSLTLPSRRPPRIRSRELGVPRGGLRWKAAADETSPPTPRARSHAASLFPDARAIACGLSLARHARERAAPNCGASERRRAERTRAAKAMRPRAFVALRRRAKRGRGEISFARVLRRRPPGLSSFDRRTRPRAAVATAE
jgi:hypothetical protein